MEYLTVKEAADKASTCLSFITLAIQCNEGISPDVQARLSDTRVALNKLHRVLPYHLLAKSKTDYVYKNKIGKIVI